MKVSDHIDDAFADFRVKRETVTTSPYYGRASQAGQCARQVTYYILAQAGHIPGSPPPPLSSRIAWYIGDAIHDLVFAAVRRFDPDASGEHAWSTDLLSGHADAVYHDENGVKTVLEAKSMAYSYFVAAVSRGAPRSEHVLQASVSALIIGATQIHIVYVCKNAPQTTDSIVEWVFPLHVTDALMAVETLEYAARSARAGIVPERLYQGRVIPLPSNDEWACKYCPFIERCLMDGPGSHALARVEARA